MMKALKVKRLADLRRWLDKPTPPELLARLEGEPPNEEDEELDRAEGQASMTSGQ